MQKIRSQSRLAICKPASLKIPILLALICFLNVSLVCAAATINVPADYLTIQAAINAAFDADEIIVSPGAYYENINFNGKNIILRSTDRTSKTIVATTIIDGRSTDSVVTFSGTELANCVISGFTIANGYSGRGGGGIYGNGTLATIQYNNITTNTAYYHYYHYGSPCGAGINDCDGTIQNNTISGNTADRDGGGLYGCEGIILNNTIFGNSASGGGGLAYCNGTIQNNRIWENLAKYSGGGLYWCNGAILNNIICENSSWNNGGGLARCGGIIQDNTISNNSADKLGGGMSDCNGTILNNTIWGNQAEYYGGGLYGCCSNIRNCIVWQNTATTDTQLAYCATPYNSCIQDWTGAGRGNISADPRFVDPYYGDYHLQGDSPCIDSGNKLYLTGEYIADIDGECRIAGESLDIGSDEYGSSPDRDGDLLADSDETTHGTDLNNPDTDDDGLQDGVEVLRGTNPAVFDTPPGISIPADYLSIQQALFLAFTSEVITLLPGTYTENIHFLGKNVILRSTNPTSPAIVASTIIDGGSTDTVVTFAGTELTTCVLSGFTIANGYGLYGGGIYGNGSLATIQNNNITTNTAVAIVRWPEYYHYDGCGGGLSDCDGTIQNSTISGNWAERKGAGLYDCDGTIRDNPIVANSGECLGAGLSECDGTIQHNSISNNSASSGGGLYECSGIIKDNTIFRNTAHYYGAGLSSCDGIIESNIISGNSAGHGGGGFFLCEAIIQNNIISGNSAKFTGGGLASCSGTIQNNTIFGNSADRGGGLYWSSRPVNCIIWANIPHQTYWCPDPAYCCIEHWTEGGIGNISSDPQLVDPANADFHLLPNSPCIDAGGTVTLAQDFEGDPRPWNGSAEPRGDGSDFDIGADEYYIPPTPTPTPTPSPTPCVIYVPEDYTLIQDAIDAAAEGCEIIVSPGTYYENINFFGKNIILRSTDPTSPTVVASTIIDGSLFGSVVTFSGSEDETCVLSGFTITNGRARDGGGIFADSTEATIQYNNITGNRAYGHGGGLCGCNGTGATIQYNNITGNIAYDDGGGLYGFDGTIQNNTISDNLATGDYAFGGGLSECHGTIQNNTISDNSARHGGGLYSCDGIIQNNIISHNSATGKYGTGGGLASCNGIIQNNIISHNSASSETYGGAGLIFCYGTIQNNTISHNSATGTDAVGGGLYDCDGAIRNCIIWRNTASSAPQLYRCSTPSYSCIQDWTGGGTGNIYFDPALVDPDNGDFHVRPVSPCIDAGGTVTLGQDFEGDPRPYDAISNPYGDGSDFDIGADEFIGILSPNYPPEKPTNISPANGATGVLLILTLESSTFADPNAGELHFASQWQIDDNRDFSSPDYDSGFDTVHKISIIATPRDMKTLTMYYWRVRHMDNRNKWSEWSDPTNFTTKAPIVLAVPDDYSTIQQAIDAATDGDEIIVSPGIYYESINFNGKNIVLRSIDPTNPSVVASTIIDGNRAFDSVVRFSGREHTTCVLSGFTITNGAAPYGGGINGGGIAGIGTQATIQHNNITNNAAYYNGLYGGNGGGLTGCDGTIEFNNISGNLATYFGGGLKSCDGIIQNNVISQNVSRMGEGGGLYYCRGTIQNNTISGNSASRGGGLAYCPRAIIRNCIIWQNIAPSGPQLRDDSSTPSYSCIQDWTGGGTGNISFDPQLVDPDNGDFHLQSTSQCIDAGGTVTLAQDFEGDPRPWDATSEPRGDGSDYDIGADEYYIPPTPTPTPTPSPTPCVIYVPENYTLIQDAIDAAAEGCEIIVSPDTYYENINFFGKNIILRSTDPTSPTVVASTIIDGNQAGSVVIFTGAENESCVLAGFTITSGYAPYGGGINGNINGSSADLGTLATIQYNHITSNTAYNSFPSGVGGGLYNCDGIIKNNIISGNSAESLGGGLCYCDGIIQDNTISQNSAHYGGGLNRCNATIKNNIISDNIAQESGGGLTYCHGIIDRNIISGNTADYGGGLDFCRGTIRNNIIRDNIARYSEGRGGGISNCDGTIINNTIFRNSAPGTSGNGGGLSGCKGTLINNTIYGNSAGEKAGGLSGCHGFIINCIIWGNSAPADSQVWGVNPPFYSCVQNGGDSTRGTISADPRFLDPANGDFHLHSDSPCIDAGNKYYLYGGYLADMDGECRIIGSNVDMGSHEYGSSLDNDGDLLVDSEEGAHGCDANNPDTDGDGLLDGLEVIRGTDPIIFNTPPGISVPTDYPLIQQALFLAFPSEEITISPGTYYERIHILGKNMTLQSSSPLDSRIVDDTVIDGEGLFTVITFEGTEDETCVVKGLSIRNGGSALSGGGICGNRTKATIENNKIVNNMARNDGAGISWFNGIIQNNAIVGNSVIWGSGGGLCYCWEATIQNNIIAGNSAYYGGGMFRCDDIIQNNTIWGNSATGGAYSRGGGLEDCDGTIRNCTIWANTAVSMGDQLHECSTPSYSCIQDWTEGGTGNISSDPQLVDPANGDFRLRSTSPCVDAGALIADLTKDLEGDPRPWDGTSEPRGDGSDYDIGTDEYIGPIRYDFAGSDEGWRAGTAVIFSEPQWMFEPGSLKLISHTNTNTFGFWVSPENAIPANEQYLYRAQFVVSTDVTEPPLVPQIRLRVNARNFQQADYLTIDSNGDGGASPAAAGTTYELYFIPPANDDYCMMAFDLLNFNPSDAPDAELALESVLVERFRLDTLDESTTITWTYDFESSQEFWFTGNGTPEFTDPESFWADGALHLRSTTNTNTFGYWGSDPADITIEANQLYRGTFEVRTDEPERSLVPQMRLRFNTANLQASRSLEIASAGDGANSPGTANTTYARLYFLPPANCVGEGLIVSFDILNFNPGDAPTASLVLDRATIETLSPPALP